MTRKVWLYTGAFVLIVLIALQLFQFLMPGFPPDNPPVTNTINWDSSQTETLWGSACADCHSNETVWPIYSYIAPASFLVISHVEEGRSELNVSTGREIEVDEMVEVLREGHPPRDSYIILHPEARLSDAQRDQLITGLRATFGGGNNDGNMDEAGEDEDEHDDDD